MNLDAIEGLNSEQISELYKDIIEGGSFENLISDSYGGPYGGRYCKINGEKDTGCVYYVNYTYTTIHTAYCPRWGCNAYVNAPVYENTGHDLICNALAQHSTGVCSYLRWVGYVW